MFRYALRAPLHKSPSTQALCLTGTIMASQIRYSTFPRTEPPEIFVENIIQVFRAHENEISTTSLKKGLTSDSVLTILAVALEKIGFAVERGKTSAQKIDRPVFYGENGQPTLKYEIDAFHTEWKCGLEVEAGRALMGNAIYRDLIQSAVMVGVGTLCLAVPNEYKYKSGGKPMSSRDYEKTVQVAEALFGHSRVSLPYNLVVIGY